MEKIYHLEYLFTGGERHLQTVDINQFSRDLDRILEDPHCIQSTIKIYTEEKE